MQDKNCLLFYYFYCGGNKAKNIHIDFQTKNYYVIGYVCGSFAWGRSAALVRIPSVYEKLMGAFCKFKLFVEFILIIISKIYRLDNYLFKIFPSLSAIYFSYFFLCLAFQKKS